MVCPLCIAYDEDDLNQLFSALVDRSKTQTIEGTMVIQLQILSAPPYRFLPSKMSIPPNKPQKFLRFTPAGTLRPALPTLWLRIPASSGGVRAERQGETIHKLQEVEANAEGGQLEKGEGEDFSSGREDEDDEEDYKAAEEEFSHASAYRARRDERDYDRDPELAEILGSCFEDPKKAQSKVLLLICLFFW